MYLTCYLKSKHFIHPSVTNGSFVNDKANIHDDSRTPHTVGNGFSAILCFFNDEE